MNRKLNKLTPEEHHVIINKGTERPFTGKYENFSEQGVYTCKQCDAPLYRSEDKFHSHCGWPSFDDEIPDAIQRKRDADGRRIEIVCAHCDGHLGHVFEGEGMTDKNIRHCVNSISMNFIPGEEEDDDDDENTNTTLQTAYFAGGCFWGVEHLLQQQPGVVSAVSGYMGGTTQHPTYQEVCSHTTGHLEVVQVTYRSDQVNFETLARFFFEIHDPTQVDAQGPDAGEQYASAIFYETDEERQSAEHLINVLEEKGYQVATRLLPVSTFWEAEEYHQDYYEKNGKKPYCHRYEKKF